MNTTNGIHTIVNLLLLLTIFEALHNFFRYIHAWHKMQRIRPSWTVIAFSGFAHERNKNPRWRRPGVKNFEHLGAYFLSRFVGLKTYHLATSSKNK